MAKRPALTFAALRAAKPEADQLETPAPAPVDAKAPTKGPGRPAKADGRTFSTTLRMSPGLRSALRAAADQDTDGTGVVVSVHDVIVGAIRANMKKRGLRITDD